MYVYVNGFLFINYTFIIYWRDFGEVKKRKKGEFRRTYHFPS